MVALYGKPSGWFRWANLLSELLVALCQSGVWRGSSSIQLLVESTASHGLPRSFVVNKPALLFADATANRGSSSGDSVYATITINGVTCANDRFFAAGASKVSSAACTRVLVPGSYTVSFSAYTSLSSVIVVGL